MNGVKKTKAWLLGLVAAPLAGGAFLLYYGIGTAVAIHAIRTDRYTMVRVVILASAALREGTRTFGTNTFWGYFRYRRHKSWLLMVA